MKTWYWVVVAIWAVTGLPGLLLGLAFGEGALSWPTADTALQWLLAWVWIASPLLLLPIARKS